MDQEQAARIIRQAWIDGVTQYYPGTPKEGYVASWENITEWERQALRLLYTNVRNIIEPSLQEGITIPPEHGGYLIASTWNLLMFQLLHDPKSSYVKHFDQLDEWQQKTDIGMFEAIVQVMTQKHQSGSIA